MKELQGRFGLDNDYLVPGTLYWDTDGSFILELEDFIFSPEQLDMSKPNMVTQSGDPAKIVADYLPRDIVGTLDDGQAVTLFSALMQDALFLFSPVRQKFRGSMVLMGAHLSGEHDRVDGLRWVWRLPLNMNFHQEGSADSVIGPIPGVLNSWNYEQGKGLEFRPNKATPLQTLRRKVQDSCGQLLGLWSAREVPQYIHTEVLVGGTWHALIAGNDASPTLARSGFMPDQDLSKSLFAAWIPLAHKIDPIHFILNGLTRTLQIDAQVLATGLEGLHRRLCEDSPRFDGVSRRAVERASKKARDAGVDALLQEGLTDGEHANAVFSEVLRHLNQMTYRDRTLDLVRPVYEVIPSLFGPDLLKWVEMMKGIRNLQSHQLIQDFDEPSISTYYVGVESCRWAMIIRILLELNPNYDFKSSLARSERFSFALANIDREQIWEDFSTLTEFRNHIRDKEPEAD